MSIKIGAWDCHRCGHKKIYGLDKHCPQCNSPRPEEVEFYLPEDAQYVTDEKIIAQAEAGADWVCSYCNAHNPNTVQICNSCGNDRDKKEDKSIAEIEYGLNEVPTAATNKRKRFEQTNLNQNPKTELKTNQAGLDHYWKKHLYWIIGLAAIGILLGLLGIKKDIELEVVGFSWQRVIYTEVYKEVSEEDWSVPAGGRQTSSRQAIHHYDRIPDGYETKTRTVRVKTGTERYKCGSTSKGNGAFKDKYCTRSTYRNKTETYRVQKYRREPVYRTKYSYLIFRWVSAEDISTQGQDKNPYWGATNFNSSYREKSRKETYKLELIDEQDHAQTETVDFRRWQQLNLRDKLIGRRNMLGVYCGLKGEN